MTGETASRSARPLYSPTSETREYEGAPRSWDEGQASVSASDFGSVDGARATEPRWHWREPYVPCLPILLHHHSIDLTLIWLERLVGWAPRTAAAVPLQNSRSPIATAPHPHGWETKILPPVPPSRVRREPNQRIVTCCYRRVA
ncbi:hypothetical protein COCCADRAFT_27311 [Bipolaris zeicola 26-R-13]|uniref:Uncharacterized protein n=1 Tax=Cochliobolus carbonum (strain 26-R-13) TaxID=930089 RepID=W6YL07_COCC2|nr:uncharacterized protein COCCADRAFT_27311 [Bipolaris zeicola 26-R-13]EUC32071.1 hypothetical protein COCCADRAFT_27311 [Bipolaris zeicola 26-R-13]